MPSFDSTTQTKITSLRTLRSAGTPIEVFELVKVSWPSPDGDIYYAVTQVDEVASVAPSVSPIQARLIPSGYSNWFLPVQMEANIGDEEVDLDFWDADGAISDLMIAHGEGVKAEIFYWFPQATLLLPVWQGHLRNEDEGSVDTLPLKAVRGFRSADANIPHRAHYKECQAVFGGLFTTQAQIDEGDCPYNRQISGGVKGNLNSGVPYTFCPRRTLADCTARLGDSLYHLSHNTVSSVVINNQTSGPRLISTSLGNETQLKEPVRVVMGARRIRDMKVMVFRRDLNNNNPEHGWFLAQYEACEGPVELIKNSIITVGNSSQDADPYHYGHRYGGDGEPALNNDLTTHNYSGTAHILYNFGWVDPTTVEPEDASASSVIHGIRNLRRYTDADPVTYVEEWNNNRVWHLMRLLCDKRWGFGLDYDLFDIQIWMDTATWAGTLVRYTDPFGTNWDHYRAMCDVELVERKVQQQVDDLCMAGRLSRPFLFNGKICIVPLSTATDPELAAAPNFTDTGDSPNIIWEDDRSTLTISRKSDLDLPNRIECTYDNVENNHLETPLAPVEDIDAQLRAGRVVGDNSRKVNVKKFPLLGVVREAHALKVAWSILDLGEFDEGGLQNNLRLTFKIWFLDALDLHPAKIIKVTSARVQKYKDLSDVAFQYFRILTIEREDNLVVKITAQAYAKTYMDSFESGTPSTPTPEVPGPAPEPEPCLLGFGTVTYSDGVLRIPIPPC